MIMRMWHISPLLPNAGVPVGSQRHHIKSSPRTRVVESRHAEVHSPPGEKIAHLTAELSERVACSLLFLREQKDEPVHFKPFGVIVLPRVSLMHHIDDNHRIDFLKFNRCIYF